MRGSDEKVLDEVVFARGTAGDALAATVLAAVCIERQALDVTVVADRDRVHFLGDEILVVDAAEGRLDDHRPPIVAELIA